MPDDNELLSDDELAILERAMESGDPSGVEFHSRKRAEYRLAFEFIDELAAPIRTAIESLDRPPVLEEYEELTEIARGGMGVVYRGLHKKTQRYDAVKSCAQTILWAQQMSMQASYVCSSCVSHNSLRGSRMNTLCPSIK